MTQVNPATQPQADQRHGRSLRWGSQPWPSGGWAEFLGPMIVAGLVATCGVIEFELGWATRSGKEFEELRAEGGRRRVNAVGRQ
jgi:hypothetical protein